MATSPIVAARVPNGNQAPATAADLGNLAEDLEKFTVFRFATTAARDAAIPQGSRKAGMLCWVDTVGYHQVVKVDSGTWLRLAPDDLYEGTELAIVGSAPPAGTPKIRQEFTKVLSVSNAQGGFVGNYPEAFANGITSLTLTPGDNAASLGMTVPVVPNLTLTQFNGVAYHYSGSGGLGNGSIIRVNVVVVGW